MTKEQAISRLRSEVKQLACAAAATCLRDRLEGDKPDAPLIAFDVLARQLAAPALYALEVIAGEPQSWPYPPADENVTRKSTKGVKQHEQHQ
jgi:hypothetical protein